MSFNLKRLIKENIFYVLSFLFPLIFIFFLSKEVVLLNEEMLLIVTVILFIVLSFDFFSEVLGIELNKRSEGIRFSFLQAYYLYDSMMKVLVRNHLTFFGSRRKCFFAYGNIKRAERYVEYYTISNASRELQKYVVDLELRTILSEEYKFLKFVYDHSLTSLEEGLVDCGVGLVDFSDYQIDSVEQLL